MWKTAANKNYPTQDIKTATENKSCERKKNWEPPAGSKALQEHTISPNSEE